MFQTPILFLLFNRPETTGRVFDVIKVTKPRQLFIAADGPRTYIKNEKEVCDSLKKTIIDSIDWDCEVKTLFRESNLGCQEAVSSAITWFFSHTEQGIILEDDCVPALDFFSYCEYMLEKYKDNRDIAMISGTNFFMGQEDYLESYFFSKHFAIWGWATWKNKWDNLYVNELTDWPEKRKQKWIYKVFENKNIAKFYTMTFDKMSDGLFDTWDINWNYSLLDHNQLTITPTKNLISNIGISGTHSDYVDQQFFYMKTGTFDSSHVVSPAFVKQNEILDKIQYENTGLGLFSWKITLRLFFKKIHILPAALYFKKLFKL